MTLGRKSSDPWLFVLGLLATTFGLIVIFDAGFARSIGQGQLAPHEFVMQVALFPVGLLLYFFASRISPVNLKRLARALWILTLVLLVLAMVPPFRSSMGGAYRWVKVGPLMIQPAEFAKLAVILYLAAILSDRKRWPQRIKPARDLADFLDRIAGPKLKRAGPAILVLLAIGIIVREPDLGTGAVLAVVMLALLWQGGITKASMAGLLCIFLIGVGVAIKLEPYRWVRIIEHGRRWDADNVDDIDFQTDQSELAQANGGLTGVGPGAGRAKHVLPATTTDFIMATVGEEFGLLGVTVVLAVIFVMCVRLYSLALKVDGAFGTLVLSGMATWIAVQTCTNVMMANGLLPAIGIPLPFISSGGSSLLALWTGLGVCQAALVPVKIKEEDPIAPNRNGGWDGRSRFSRA